VPIGDVSTFAVPAYWRFIKWERQPINIPRYSARLLSNREHGRRKHIKIYMVRPNPNYSLMKHCLLGMKNLHWWKPSMLWWLASSFIEKYNSISLSTLSLPSFLAWESSSTSLSPPRNTYHGVISHNSRNTRDILAS